MKIVPLDPGCIVFYYFLLGSSDGVFEISDRKTGNKHFWSVNKIM